MSRKTADAYIALFNYIQKNIIDLEPTEIISDFEGGLRKAVNTVFPRTRLRGCWFHFKMAITKKCKALQLSPEMEPVSKLKELPLLPENLFLEGYNGIKEEANQSGLLKASKKLRKLFSYFEKFWLKQVRDSAWKRKLSVE